MSDELPESVRLSGGGFAWRERDLSPRERFAKELAELDELRDRGPRDEFLAKIDRLIALTDPDSLGGLTESDREVASEILDAKLARWREGDDDPEA